MMKTVVVVPTYNEADNLPVITADLLAQGIIGLEILVVDDDSPDGTGQIADELAKRYAGQFHVLHRQGKLGLGTAYVQGFTWALDHEADFIIQMDADFSHSPAYIPKLLELINDCDVVVGSRYVRGGQLDERWSLWRWFLSWWANSIWTRLILGVHAKDATAGFKCWRRQALEQIGLNRIRSNGYVFQVEMAVPVKLEAAIRVFEIRWRHRHAQPVSHAVEAQA